MYQIICGSLLILQKEAYGLDTEAVAQRELQMKKQLSYWTILVWKLFPRVIIAKAEGAEQIILTDTMNSICFRYC